MKFDVKYSMAQNGLPKSQWELYSDLGRRPVDRVWLCRSADNGYATAQLEVGDIYWQSTDIDRNKIKAYVWYKLAATGDALQNCPADKQAQGEAAKALQEARQSLTSEQLLKAESLYAAWSHGQCELELVQPAVTGE